MTKFDDTSSVQEDTTAHQRSRLLERVAAIKADASAHAAHTTTVDAVAAVRRDLLGKSGSLLVLRRELGGLEESVRREAGAAIAAAQRELTALLDAREQSLRTNEHAIVHPLDVTVPGLAPEAEAGTLHPTTQMMYDLNDAFSALNFAVYEGPEVSSELFEFDKMNFPEGHPARENMDTYWVSGTENQHGAQRLCLRPHLTGASIRYMRENEPPYRFVYPGRVYRNESTDARHERAFYQYEVLIVDEIVPLTTARFLVDTILDTVFGEPVRTRMRAGFFPFVEPGFEVDMQCRVCGGVGCRTCGQVGWLEVMPGGSPHPNVLAAAGLDPERWSGCYVNVGLDRLVMMRYGIDDVRLMHGGDLRFLDQFA